MNHKFKIYHNCSLSLCPLLDAKSPKPKVGVKTLSRTMSLAPTAAPAPQDLIRVLIEADSKKRISQVLKDLGEGEQFEELTTGAFAATLSRDTLRQLATADVKGLRISSKKRSVPHLDRVAIDTQLLASGSGTRQVSQTGDGVFIGIVDSGFDLTHPMFRDSANKLRVAGLLVQRETTLAPDQEFTTAQIELALSSGENPAVDENGHGTHVATIAGGSKFEQLEGVAPKAKFLLVKTNFIDTDKAVSWIFNKSGTKPCVVNLSLGHHFGAHDGTDAEERLFETITGPGKLIVASAGNERNDSLHIGGRFSSGETQTVTFDVLRPQDGSPPEAGLSLWFSDSDDFEFSLFSPSGQQFDIPAGNQAERSNSSVVDVIRMRGPFSLSRLVQVQLQVIFHSASVQATRLKGWRLRCKCTNATVGRLDGWFFNSGFARFRSHPLVETARTIGLPATSRACISVASHVSKTKWKSDNGTMSDTLAVTGRSSDFSSLGPTRDGREKPEISGPGQYVTAALATGSELEEEDDRSLDAKRLLTIEGTSMSAPVVTGIIALMLEKKGNLTPDKVRTILASSARKDSHTGTANWNPTYGFGKIDVVQALANT